MIPFEVTHSLESKKYNPFLQLLLLYNTKNEKYSMPHLKTLFYIYIQIKKYVFLQVKAFFFIYST